MKSFFETDGLLVHGLQKSANNLGAMVLLTAVIWVLTVRRSLVWRFNGHLGMSSPPPVVRSFQCVATNPGKRAIVGPFRGGVESVTFGSEYKLMYHDDGNPRPLEQLMSIPAGAQINFAAFFREGRTSDAKNGVPEMEFEREVGEIVFWFAWKGGSIRRRFSAKQSREAIDRFVRLPAQKPRLRHLPR